MEDIIILAILFIIGFIICFKIYTLTIIFFVKKKVISDMSNSSLLEKLEELNKIDKFAQL